MKTWIAELSSLCASPRKEVALAVISFSENPEHIWVVAGWAFRQVLDDTLAQYPDNLEMARKFEESSYIPGLILYLLDPVFAKRITHAIRQSVLGILSGEIQSGIVKQPYGDARTIEQYYGGLRELLRAIPADSK